MSRPEKHDEEAAAREALFAKVCLSRGEKPAGALAIYRRLVRSGLATTVFRLLPRSRARINALHDDAFDEAFVAFLDEVAPQTHFMRDVPSELVRFAEKRWREANVEESLIELARYEAACFAVESAPDDDDVLLDEIALSRPVVLTRALRIERFTHAVHELAENEADRELPERRETALLIYRDADHDVVELVVTPLFADLVDACASGQTLGDALKIAATHQAATIDDALLADVARFLADLGERGALLGGAPLSRASTT